ncbi:MAG: hypothetical protein AB7U81_01630 [Thiohalomonadaceae bacterium]
MAIVPFLVPLSPSGADEFDDELARQDALERQAAAVNEGRLEFLLQAPPGPPVHHQHNRILFDGDSLESGWVSMQQCHENLDAVSSTEIVFHPDRISDLRVDSHTNIGGIVVDGTRVQLEDVGAGASLCISARSHALRRDESGGYVLRNGPFMRRFLDGYYPLHVTMEVLWPDHGLRFVQALPEPQPGFTITAGMEALRLDTLFEGRLVTELRFEPA